MNATHADSGWGSAISAPAQGRGGEGTVWRYAPGGRY